VLWSTKQQQQQQTTTAESSRVSQRDTRKVRARHTSRSR